MLARVAHLLIAGLVDQPARPEPIVGGQDVGVCEFPASVFIGAYGGFHCTASLVHPRVIITAAHCMGGIDMVGFGEDIWNPAYTVAVESCAAHPDYDFYGIDLGVCTLTEDAPAVAMAPPLMGCEADVLTPGREITITGFGQDDEASGSGAGEKRTTTNTVDEISLENNEAYLLGNANGSCFGDSGGPAYVQLDDGSWRVFAAVSGPHPNAPPLGCGFGGTYELIYTKMDWIESQTGYDVTPCFDADGTWNPDERCTEFPTALDGGGSWDAACGPSMVSGPSASCGEPIDGLGDTGGGESGDHGGEETGHVDPSDTGDPSGGGDGDGDSGDAGDDGTGDDGTGDDGTGDDGGAVADDPVLPPGFGLGGEQAGCGIAGSRRGTAAWLVVLIGGGVVVRRRAAGRLGTHRRW